ncbi:MAG TPA: glycosyltransferase [Gaiellaceae bacterium]|nr:glycosyltransferase [Gaiellaceae bacterium]
MRVAILSTYPPRACGIGTFSHDVRQALLTADGVDDVSALVIVDQPSAPQRPEILQTISQGARGDYVRAARGLARTDVDVVLLEHEYGIFGGRDGEYVLSLVNELSQPLVVTLHTVLAAPTPGQRRVLSSLCDEAERVIVMTETARHILENLGVCDPGKIAVVPHGAPPQLAAARLELDCGRSPRYLTATAGGFEEMEARFVLSTFGLISPGKGLEVMLEALPGIVARHPEALYVIAGRTHPQVARRQGEEYRLLLERRVLELELGKHVVFDDRFLSVDELADLLAATDVFVTPYASREQSSSGSLTFALASGCAAISTPYWYARDVLASGAGTLVDFGDAEGLGAAVCAYVEAPEALARARREARRISATFAWSSVGAATATALRQAVTLAPRRPTFAAAGLELPDARTDHLLSLVDDCGIVQHAHGAIPNRATGYCVDDVARLAVVALELERRTGDRPWASILYRSLAFLNDASDPDGAGMRNFMSYDRRWLDSAHIGDHVGRSIWALGEVLATAWAPPLVDPTRRLLDTLVKSLDCDVPNRTAAYATLGLAHLDADRLNPGARLLLQRCVTQLEDAYIEHADHDWCWFEDALAYDNARLPQALIVGGAALERPDAIERGLSSLAWFGDECGLNEGVLRLPGHVGRHRDETGPGAGDEQPLEASAIVDAELAAFAITGDIAHGARAKSAFDWFLGRNKLSRPLYDFATGGCCDGLGDEDVNANEGAESTLAFHRAHLAIDAAGLPRVARVVIGELAA